MAEGDRPLPRTKTRPDTRAAILKVALELFAAQGYQATSLRQIAQQLDVTTAALFYHFPAKGDLLMELVRPLIDGIEEILALPDEEPPTQLLDMYLELVIREHKVANLLATDPAASSHEEIGPVRRRLFGQLERRIAGPDATDEDRVRALCALRVTRAIAELPVQRARTARPVVLRAARAALAAR